MNLGDVYLKSFFAIVVLSFIVAFAIASVLRFKRCSWTTVFLVALPLWLAIGFAGLELGHQPLFRTWHRNQNQLLPAEGCLSYQPEATRLYATYAMRRNEFEKWTASHPWELHEGSNSLLSNDGPRLGLENPELSFESETAPNGKQLRVYFDSGTMFVAYNAM